MNIEKVAVVGAGVMGGAIAAHLANAGVSTYLLDIVPPGAGNRNILAETALARLSNADPPAFMRKSAVKRIVAGNIEDHSSYLGAADWIVEAVVEDLQIKQSLYRKLHEAARPDAVVSSNTSVLPARILTEGLPEAFRQRFMITHFFNPPRYMRLLELAAGADTRPELYEAVAAFADIRLGKECVACHDTPGFVANRIGVYWLQWGLLEAMRLGIGVEAADILIGKPLGIPKTGIFGLFDLVGIDLAPHVMENLASLLPADDDFHRVSALPPLIDEMIGQGYTGRKGKGGFYRLNASGGKRVKESIDLATGEYRPAAIPDLDSVRACREGGIRALLNYPDKYGEYAWQVLSHTLNYAASLIPEVARDIADVDRAFRYGFNWRKGPFELLDSVGVDWYVEKLLAEGRAIPPLLTDRASLYRTDAGIARQRDLSGQYVPIVKPSGVLTLSDIKPRGPAVWGNSAADLWDAGDGVACLEFHTKMNTLNADSMAAIERTIGRVERDFAALVIYSDAEHFSAGADLTMLLKAIERGDEPEISRLIELGQTTFKALKYAPFPVVGAPFGFALGGGCEILLHCDAIVAHAELYMGLVETGVGLIPCWGGCKEFLGRSLSAPHRPAGPVPPVAAAFETIALAKVSTSAFEAREAGFLSPSDGIVMNRNRLLAEAKAKALSMVPGYRPPLPVEYVLPGPSGRCLLDMNIRSLRAQGKISDYDAEIGGRLADVLTGGETDPIRPVSEDALLSLERRAFLALTARAETRARLEYMLKTGKPLRN